MFSLTLETLQLVLRVGGFGVDDMLVNTIGAAVGFWVYKLVQRTRVRMRRRQL